MGNHNKSDSPNYLKTTIKFNRALLKYLLKLTQQHKKLVKPSISKVSRVISNSRIQVNTILRDLLGHTDIKTTSLYINMENIIIDEVL